MQHLFSESLRKLKRTVYYQPAGISVESYEGEPEPACDPKEMERIADQSQLAYYTTLKQLSLSVRRVEEGLVNKVAAAVSMSMPELSCRQVEHALFAKKIYLAGEIGFQEYIIKMRNLFPDRMAALPEALQLQIAQQLLGINRKEQR